MMELLLILLLIIPISTSLPQVTAPAQGQCQAVCLNEYASIKEFHALDGSGYREADALNNSDFALCKLGCRSPGFTELKLKPFKRGQAVYSAIIDRDASASVAMASTQSPIQSVTLLCADRVENNGSVFWRIELDVRNDSADGMMAHWIDAVRRTNGDESTDAIIFGTWSYTSYVDFFGVVDIANSSVQFRVSSFNGSGLMGPLMSSQWYTEEQLAGGNYIQMVVGDEIWKEEMAAVRVNFKASHISSCSLVLAYNSHTGVEQQMELIMDRSRGFLLDRLAFDHPYTLRLWRVGAATTAFTSHEFRTPKCLELVHDPAFCAPPPVSEISWVWNSSESEGNRIVLSWTYGSLSQIIEEGPRVERRDSLASSMTAFPRMVHFDISVNPLLTPTQYQCQFLDVQRRVVTWTHRSVALYVPNEHCNYGIEITVVDSRNRRSTTTKVQVIRFEEKYQMLLSADGWNTGVMALSLIVLASFVTVSGALVFCRIRDRREWNTIKRSISPPLPGLAIKKASSSTGVKNKYVLKERCQMRSPNMVRLSFSDYNEAPMDSTSIVKKNNTMDTLHDGECVNVVTSTVDDTDYDTIGTPRLTHNPCQAEKCSGGCLAAAIITSPSSTVPNTLIVPHDCLIMTRRVRSAPLSLWTTKHVVWPTTGQRFSIKYSQQGVGLLRRELKILNHITVDHQNLVKWMGVGVCNDQVLSLLFEQCSGGALAFFLDDARKALSYGASFDMLTFERKVHFLAYNLHRFALNIAQALVFLHNQGCTHSHVTAENVYLALDYNDPLDIPCDQSVKLGDFCWAIVPRVKCARIQFPQSLLPPEMLSKCESSSSATDVWQYGLLLASMVTLNSAQDLTCLPSDKLLTDKIIKNYYTCLSSGIRQVEPFMSSLKSKILMCLTSNVRSRATMKKIEKEVASLDFTAPDSMTGTNSVLV
ncbi:Protein kinase domain-containing protein [Trichostrongylus colubriformis]|uniref:non-specific serine/threonine protein kinase n=1 Tax=Trichostrongylus colubriformis TaxID=6319 RepID=A0AAN8ID14_TRICO